MLLMNFLFHTLGGKRPGRLLVPSLPLPVRKREIRELEVVVQGHGEDGRSPDLSELSCLPC